MDDHHIEPVPGRLDEPTRREVLAFWAAHGALHGEEAVARLEEVVCLVRHRDGTLAGVSSAFQAPLPMLGGRVLWVHRRFLAPGLHRAALEVPLAEAAYDALASPGGGEEAPIGLCLLVDDPQIMREHPEAVWPSGFFYAGYLPDGRQVRVRYFPEARIA